MQLGAVIPHHEIGTDPGAIRAFAQGAEELGATHLLIYDHVVGVDRNRPGGFEGPYDSNTAFHEPMVLFGFLAACTTRVDLMTAMSRRSSPGNRSDELEITDREGTSHWYRVTARRLAACHALVRAP